MQILRQIPNSLFSRHRWINKGLSSVLSPLGEGTRYFLTFKQLNVVKTQVAFSTFLTFFWLLGKKNYSTQWIMQSLINWTNNSFYAIRKHEIFASHVQHSATWSRMEGHNQSMLESASPSLLAWPASLSHLLYCAELLFLPHTHCWILLDPHRWKVLTQGKLRGKSGNVF